MPGDWFQELFGFQEAAYDTTQKRLKVVPAKQGAKTWRIEGSNGRSYSVGRFWTPSLSELQATCRKHGGMSALPGRLRVRNVTGDVAAKHGEPENKYATFQVASQFNCLEFVGPSVTPEHGITGYVNDRTQGPACSIACGPATAYRNYFAEVGGSSGQRRDRQINNLDRLLSKVESRTGELIRTQGGYTMANDQALRTLNSRLRGMSETAYKAARRELRIGVHEDVQVTSSAWGTRPVTDKEQTVSQVFGSACSVSYSGNSRALWAPFARLVLSASYEATLWSALLSALRHGGSEGSRIVYLTCLGGGVFGNELEWITKAMSEAFKKFEHVGLEIRIVTYAGPIDPQLQAFEKQFLGSKAEPQRAKSVEVTPAKASVASTKHTPAKGLDRYFKRSAPKSEDAVCESPMKKRRGA